MQSRNYKTILILFVWVAAFLALSVPATGYTDSSGYRASHGLSSGYRGLDRSHGKHLTHRQNSRNSHFAAIKQNNSAGSTSGNRGSQRLSSGSRDLNKNQGLQSSSRQKRNHRQRENVDSHKKQGHINHNNNRLGTVGQQINNGRNERVKSQKNPGGFASGNRLSQRLSSGSRDLNKNQGLQSSSRQKRNHRQRENVDSHKKQGHINHNNRPGTVGQQIINGRNKHFKTQNNPGLPASKLQNLLIRKNPGLTKDIKSRVNSKQIAAIRPGKIKRNVVTTNPLKRFKRHKAIGQHGNNLDKKATVFQTQHKQHNSHSRHNQQRHHGHQKRHGHFTRSIFSPYVFFSYSTLYYPYGYYPYAYPYTYPYTYPFYRPFGYSSPAYSYAEPVYSTSRPYGIDSPGWTYLARGNFQAAINVFTKDIQSFPDAGIPKLGFALASAAAGYLTEGVLAMREAFNVDPDSIHYFHFDEKVLLIIDDLIEKYEYGLHQSNKRPDEAFMVSALHYLKYDYGSAHEAINRAITDGDRSQSLGKLHRLVDEQFSNEYADEHN